MWWRLDVHGSSGRGAGWRRRVFLRSLPKFNEARCAYRVFVREGPLDELLKKFGIPKVIATTSRTSYLHHLRNRLRLPIKLGEHSHKV